MLGGVGGCWAGGQGVGGGALGGRTLVLLLEMLEHSIDHLLGEVADVRAALARGDRVDKRDLLEAVVRRGDANLPPVAHALVHARHGVRGELGAKEEVDVALEIVHRQLGAIEVHLGIGGWVGGGWVGEGVGGVVGGLGVRGWGSGGLGGVAGRVCTP